MSDDTDSSDDTTSSRDEQSSRPWFAPSMERLRYWRTVGETVKIWAAILGGIIVGLLALLQAAMPLVG